MLTHFRMLKRSMMILYREAEITLKTMLQSAHPRWWSTWLALGVLWLLAKLPYPWLLKLGAIFGWLLMRTIPHRRNIADVNLQLCLPDLEQGSRRALLCRHFESLGIGIIEIALSWWAPAHRLQGLAFVEGLGHLRTALKQGKGVLLITGHFTCFELAGRLLALQAHLPGRAIYRAHENPVLEWVMRRGRRQYLEKMIARGDVRTMLRSLRANKVVWYAADQNYGHSNSAFVPFFGVPAATTTAVSRLARMTGVAVIPFLPRRLERGEGYLLQLLAPLQDFPSNDVREDTARINRILEEHIRWAPEQYFWIHRRFKDQPDASASIYTKSLVTP